MSNAAKDEFYHSTVAETVEGEELEAIIGLRRFIVHTEKLIGKDWEHFFEEGVSDLPAFLFSGEAFMDIGADVLQPTGPSDSSDIAFDNIGNFGSAACAITLMYGLQQQKEWKRQDLKKALRLYVEFRDDRDEVGLQEANRRLETKMLLSGLQYTGLPDDISVKDFNKDHVIKMARSFGIFSKSDPQPLRLKQRIENVGSFLKQPPQDIAMQSISTLDRGYETLARTAGHAVERPFTFTGKLAGGLIVNAILSPKIVIWDAGKNGITDSVRLSISEAQRKSQKKAIRKHAEDGTLDVELINQSDSLFAVQHKMEELTDEQKAEVQAGLQHIRKLRRQAHATRRFLALQIGYMGFQTFQAYANATSDDPYRQQKAYVNGAGVLAAMGPLSGFSKQLRRELEKMESQRAHEIEKVARIFGLNGYAQDPEQQNTPPEQ